MGKSRPRFNEKARASSRRPNQRPHLKARDGGLGRETFEQSQPTTENTKQTFVDRSTLLCIIFYNILSFFL